MIALASGRHPYWFADGMMADGWRYSAGGVTVVTNEARNVIVTVWRD